MISTPRALSKWILSDEVRSGTTAITLLPSLLTSPAIEIAKFPEVGIIIVVLAFNFSLTLRSVKEQQISTNHSEIQRGIGVVLTLNDELGCAIFNTSSRVGIFKFCKQLYYK
jgi:hypothetical protein